MVCGPKSQTLDAKAETYEGSVARVCWLLADLISIPHLPHPARSILVLTVPGSRVLQRTFGIFVSSLFDSSVSSETFERSEAMSFASKDGLGGVGYVHKS